MLDEMREVWETDESRMLSKFFTGGPGRMFLSWDPRRAADVGNQVTRFRLTEAGGLWAAPGGHVQGPGSGARGSGERSQLEVWTGGLSAWRWAVVSWEGCRATREAKGNTLEEYLLLNKICFSMTVDVQYFISSRCAAQ